MQIGTSAPILSPTAHNASASSFCRTAHLMRQAFLHRQRKNRPFLPSEERAFNINSYLGGKSGCVEKCFCGFPYDILFIARNVGVIAGYPAIVTIRTHNADGYIVININALCRNVERMSAARQSARYVKKQVQLCVCSYLYFIDYSTPRSSRNSLMRSSAVLMC